MGPIDQLRIYFKPEVVRSGQSIFDKGSVFLTQTSDVLCSARINGTTPLKLGLSSPSIDHSDILANCSCSSRSLCKHLWATVLAISETYPDFFLYKKTIEQEQIESPMDERKAQQKERQSDYRKLQYQKQKLWANKLKKSKSGKDEPTYPDSILLSLKYFSENGFSFSGNPSAEEIANARKKLSRIFHPDMGGSHQETVELNDHCDALMRYFSS